MDYNYIDGKYKCDCGEEFASYNSWYSHNSRKHKTVIKIGAAKEDVQLPKPYMGLEQPQKPVPISDAKRAALAIFLISLFFTVIAIAWMVQTNTFNMADRLENFLDKYIPAGDYANE